MFPISISMNVKAVPCALLPGRTDELRVARPPTDALNRDLVEEVVEGRVGVKSALAVIVQQRARLIYKSIEIRR